MDELTRQQNVIVKLILEGYSNKEIADELKISYSTAKNHVTDILSRLKVASRQEIVVCYYKEKVQALEEEIKKLKGENEDGTQRTV